MSFEFSVNIVKAKKKHFPKAYVGTILKLGSIQMGKVGNRGDNIQANPFATCNLADYIGDNGRFDIVGFFQKQQDCFPTLFKLSVCL
jgi:hypothetical protein